MRGDEIGQAPLDVTVLLIDDGYASTAVAPIEIFHSAGMLWNILRGEAPEPRFRVRIASIDGGGVESLCGLRLVPALSIDDIEQSDIVILPASGLDLDARIEKDSRLLPWLRRQHRGGAHVVGICTGVGFLAESGLLDGRRATTHWAVADAMRDRFPRVDWHPEQFITEDGRVLTSGGVYASIDVSLYLVEKFCGHEIALRCAKALLVGMPRGRQSGYAVAPLSPPHCDPGIREIELYLAEHFHKEMPIELLAARAGLGARTFMRRFKAATGQAPRAYVQALRIAAARELLEESAGSIEAVAHQVGYDEVAFFRALFKRHTGMTPAEYRGTFAGMALPRDALTREELVRI